MKYTGVLSLILLLLAACADSNEDMVLDESNYNGTFMRIAPGTDAVESPISLQLSNGVFQGEADSLYYPAICEGTYTIEGNRISFTNDCGWTANFDWSYILDGTFTIEKNQNETVFIQEVRTGEYNIYRLD